MPLKQSLNFGIGGTCSIVPKWYPWPGSCSRLLARYLRHGYWCYVTGRIPAGKDAQTIDKSLLRNTASACRNKVRARRKQLGHANLQYIRHDRFFAILATKGQSSLFRGRGRRASGTFDGFPLRFAGYSISYRRGGRTRCWRTGPALACTRRNRAEPLSRTQGSLSAPGRASCRQRNWQWPFTSCPSNRMRRFADNC